jgi:SAM-dependent methyltransferase
MAAHSGKEFVPPPDLFPAREDYAEVARGLFDVLVDVGGVRAGERVLDVGCGTGRLAVPLVDHLGPEGSYEGFDMDAERIAWCNANIAPLHPGFRFQAIDVYNAEEGRREGAQRAGELTFPYPDDEFDLTFLFSVFTHMMPDGVERYLSEIARVLKPDGRALITWFLLNDESLRALDEQRDRRRDPAANALEARFGYDRGVYRITNRARPTAVVAFDEGFAREAYRRAGLELHEPIRYGSWTGREDALVVQDVVLAVPRAG